MTQPFALLRIRVQPEAPAASFVDWCSFDAAGAPQAHGQAELNGLPSAERFELVLPAARVAPHRIEVPAGAARYEAALIRQALEDRILAPLDQQVIVGGEREGARLTVWVSELAWLVALLDALAAAGIQPERITPEQALLEPGEQAATPSGWIFRRADGEYGLLPSPELLAALAGLDLRPRESVLAAPVDARRVNLVAGLPRLRRAASGLSAALLRPVLYLLIAAALAYLLAEVLTWRQLVAQETGLRETIRQNFAAARPGVPIVDPILQWRQSQGRPAQGADALDALASFAVQAGIQIQPQRVEAEENRLRLTLTTADASRLRSALQEKGIVFESTTTDNGLTQISLDPRSGGRS